MKKLLRPENMPAIPLAGGILGALLRLSYLAAGTDHKGLLPPPNAAAVLTWVLTGLMAVAMGLLVLRLRPLTQNHRAFTRSQRAAIGNLVCAVALTVSAIGQLGTQGGIFRICGILGLVSALLCVYLAWMRYQGKRALYLAQIGVTLYFMLSLIASYHSWSAETQGQVYCFQLLGLVCVMLASYQHTALDSRMGSRQGYVYFSHMAIFFCVMAAPGSGKALFYLGLAVWLALDVCKPRKLRRRSRPVVREEPSALDIRIDGE